MSSRSQLFFLIILTLYCKAIFAIEPPQRTYLKTIERSRYKELLEQHGQHKQLPQGYELQALLALSHFPELKKIKIKFRVQDTRLAISSRPYWLSLFRSAGKSTYLVSIDNEIEKGPREVLLLKNQPFNAQIGILGHELAHTAYYLNRSFFGLLSDGLCQLGRCRINFERNTDKRTINHGLGWQRYDHALFLRSGLSAAEQKARDENSSSPYMNPTDILALINNNSYYSDLPEPASSIDDKLKD